LCAAHTRAELTRAAAENRSVEESRVYAQIRAALKRFGCTDENVTHRAYELDDCEHTRWEEMEVYRLHENAHGAGTLARTQAFERVARDAFERLHEPSATPPSDLLHVTCTGYASPSPAQRLVARRGWGNSTRVTHVYHMGCYAALPALRLACGARSALPPQAGAEARSEVVHTEVCSLHLDPSKHGPEQLVIHSLFADGFIAYDVTNEPAKLGAPGLEVIGQLERTLSQSEAAMTWRCSDWGMQMTLARDVPERLGTALAPFVTELVERAGIAQPAAREARYAVHPGGPRILDRVQTVLRLDGTQLAHSRKVLRERGNMSSATLPHVWMEMATDTGVLPGVPIVSLAFGPGLTLCGAVFRKVAP